MPAGSVILSTALGPDEESWVSEMEESLDMEVDQVSCNLCDGRVTERFAERNGMWIVRCIRCGLVYVNPRLTARMLHRHYNSGQSSRIQYYLDVECADRETFAGILDVAARLLPHKGRLLDIGPNIGTCLDLSRQAGWETYGIEINEEAARYCREERGLNVISGQLNDDTFPRSHFDAVIMGDVIEHLPDPMATVRLIRAMLKPGGIVVISTPNIDSLAGRLLQIKPEEHLYYFSPATISILLDKAGLEIVQMGPLDRYHNVTAMTHSTTLGGLFGKLRPVFRLAHRVLGDVIVRLPLRENLMAVARRPAHVLAEVA
jgi:2-polyprenyl-3-methyl-5-hydroxy-6-metoxy-1,4-benzoquinol methylase